MTDVVQSSKHHSPLAINVAQFWVMRQQEKSGNWWMENFLPNLTKREKWLYWQLVKEMQFAFKIIEKESGISEWLLQRLDITHIDAIQLAISVGIDCSQSELKLRTC